MGSIALCALVLIALPAYAEWLPASSREVEGIEVERIRFTYSGKKLILNRMLRATMRTKEKSDFNRRIFNEDLISVINLYRTRGYREAHIARKHIEIDNARARVRILIEIDNGPLWTVRDVHLRGAEPFSDAELIAQIPLAAGAELDYGDVLEGERALQAYLNHRGYPHARVRNTWVDEDEYAHNATVLFEVNTGAKMYFGDVLIEGEEDLQTRSPLIHRYLSFDQGDLYDPEKIAESRNRLARTNLFRSVYFSTPTPEEGDSAQTVIVQLQERKYIHLGSNLFVNSTGTSIKPRMTGNIQHGNWLGHGIGLGLNASWGQPLQGATFSFMENDLLDSEIDLVLSAGITDEWSRKIVSGNAEDPRQFDLLTTYDSVLNGLLLFGGTLAADEYINTVTYDYASIERLWQVRGTLSKTWGELYQGQLTVSWVRARNRPDQTDPIAYAPSIDWVDDSTDASDEDLFDEDPFGDDLFGDDLFGDDPFGDDPFGEDPFGTDGEQAEEIPVDYFTGDILVDERWRDILTERSRSISLTSELLRDTRDSRIAPSRGSLLRMSGLVALELGANATSVLDGEIELRYYAPLAERVVAALAIHGTRTASLRSGRALPQLYWKIYGGEGSLRGVKRDAIQAVGGGRIGLNLRSELRYRHGTFGLVAFWDRAQVWHRSEDLIMTDIVRPNGMVNGFGLGLRYTFGFPLRLDIAFNDGFDQSQSMKFYFSIGQAF